MEQVRDIIRAFSNARQPKQCGCSKMPMKMCSARGQKAVNMPEWGPSVRSNQGGQQPQPKRQWGPSIRFNLVVVVAAAAATVVVVALAVVFVVVVGRGTCHWHMPVQRVFHTDCFRPTGTSLRTNSKAVATNCAFAVQNYRCHLHHGQYRNLHELGVSNTRLFAVV